MGSLFDSSFGDQGGIFLYLLRTPVYLFQELTVYRNKVSYYAEHSNLKAHTH